MIKGGLVSITFRQLSPREIVELVGKTRLTGIEWGGDVHVPHGDIKLAREVGLMTREAGLTVPSYGSYYRLAESEKDGLAFEKVLDTAVALETKVLRVWAGKKASADADASYRAAVTSDAKRIAKLAAEKGIEIALEYHGNTLTDNLGSASLLLSETNHSSFKTYWQPAIANSDELNFSEIRELTPKLSHLHVFQWISGESGMERRPLIDGEARWREFFKLANSATGNRFALLEFVRNDDPDQFLVDAETLAKCLEL